MLLVKEREAILKYCNKLISDNLTTGSGGNISIYNRDEGLIAISPSAIPYDVMKIGDIIIVDIDGNIVEGTKRPSSETGLHLGLYRKDERINSVVHTHSKYATALACLGVSLPPVHYIVGMAGREVRCCGYETYGSPELAAEVANSIGSDRALLMGNHGLVAVGEDIGTAFGVASQIEFAAEVYCIAKSIGNPIIISEEKMEEVIPILNKYSYK